MGEEIADVVVRVRTERGDFERGMQATQTDVEEFTAVRADGERSQQRELGRTASSLGVVRKGYLGIAAAAATAGVLASRFTGGPLVGAHQQIRQTAFGILGDELFRQLGLDELSTEVAQAALAARRKLAEDRRRAEETGTLTPLQRTQKLGSGLGRLFGDIRPSAKAEGLLELVQAGSGQQNPGPVIQDTKATLGRMAAAWWESTGGSMINDEITRRFFGGWFR